ncbi:unnamed protein product [Effrenium voratum]|nr:unnamed protein product [Effrenium voratum]
MPCSATLVAALKEQLAPQQEAILLGILPQGLCRAVLCDEDLQAVLAAGEPRFEVRPVSPSPSPRTPRYAPPRERRERGPARGVLRRPVPWVSSKPCELQQDELESAGVVWHPGSTQLMEALGLHSEYRRLRSRLRRQSDFVVDTLREHREVVNSGTRRKDGSGMKVHSRDLVKLQLAAEMFKQLEDTTEESLLQNPVEAVWQIQHARHRLSQDGRKVPRRRYWESPWRPLGPIAEVAFRIFPSGDGDAAEGNAVIFFWMEQPPVLSFSFRVEVGAERAVNAAWSSEVSWARVEFPWALLAPELSEEALSVRLVLVQWHAKAWELTQV